MRLHCRKWMRWVACAHVFVALVGIHALHPLFHDVRVCDSCTCVGHVGTGQTGAICSVERSGHSGECPICRFLAMAGTVDGVFESPEIVYLAILAHAAPNEGSLARIIHWCAGGQRAPPSC